MYVDNPNILTLARKLEAIPNVLQVRFFSPLKESVQQLGGDGCIIYQLVVNDLTQVNEFTSLKSLVPKAVIDDETLHTDVIENLTELVSNYQITQIMPTRLGTGANDMINVITTSSLYEQYQPEPVATPGNFPSI